MGIVMSEQLSVMFGALVLGVILGVIYDFFRVTRLATVSPALLVLLEDLLFFLFSSVILFSYLLRASDGKLRYFILLAVIAGWVAYYFTLGKVVMAFSGAIISVLRKVFAFFMRPVHWLWKQIARLWNKLAVNFSALWSKIKNGLKLRVIMMYNIKYAKKDGKEGTVNAVARTAANKKPKNAFDSLLKVLTIALLILLAVFLVKTTMSFAEMKEQLAQVEAELEQQNLQNKDMELTIRDNETYMERRARENDLARPGESVFIDPEGTE